VKPYKGILLIDCSLKACPQKLPGNVKPSCIDCKGGDISVIGLSGRALYKAKKPVPAKKPPKTKTVKTKTEE
jgi:hypothetical protein